MFDLNNTEKYKSRDERRLKKATILVAAITIGFYILFLLLMVVTKFGILSAFVHTKPVINSATVTKETFYNQLNFDFYYKRFNWLYSGEQEKMFFVYGSDLNEEGDIGDLSKIGWNYEKIYFEGNKIKIIPNEGNAANEYDPKDFHLDVTDFQNIGYFMYQIQNPSSEIIITDHDILNMLASKKPLFNLPNGITIFSVFGLFMLISALTKVISIAKSYRNGRLEFGYGTLGVKLACIFDIVGIMAMTYVFFWVCLWKIPVFYSVTEPSMVYYFRFMLPVIFLNSLYAFLYNRAADCEK